MILKVLAIEKTDTPPPRLVNYGGIKQTVLSVERVYKGTLKIGQKLKSAQGGGADCVWTFSDRSVGEEYLFYLGAEPGDPKSSDGVIAATGQFPKVVPSDVWIASTCTRSNSVKWAAADILYLESRSKVKVRTRLSGLITKNVRSAIEEQPSSFEPLSNHNVLVSGNGKTIKLTTDQNGVYELYDLPPGKYTVRPEAIAGFKHTQFARYDDTQVVIKPKAHTERNFYFEIDSAIRGKLFDTNGNPLKDVCMELLPARGTKVPFLYNSDCTEPDGSFELKGIPAGSYLLLFNDDDVITAEEPFRAFYYPNVKERERASEIQIAPGTKIENLVIVAPETAEVITVTGVLRMQDGKTANSKNAAFAAVEFVAEEDEEADEDNPSSRVMIDADGRFAIRILKGQKGKLYGTVTVYPGLYLNCPKLEKLIPRREGINIVDIETPSVFINAESSQAGVELKFPFPSCRLRID
ncbi:MAG: hypothetical protein IPJ30_27160 [Acidobacteria bacterium]|nr:hypothetical protein [Acidobacteriota bacterium]